jgi:hypothetical protein
MESQVTLHARSEGGGLIYERSQSTRMRHVHAATRCLEVAEETPCPRQTSGIAAPTSFVEMIVAY